MMRRKILITGGAGFVGSNLVAHLVQGGGREIVVLDDESLGRLDRLAPHGVRCVKGDIRDTAIVRDCLSGGIDTVVHLAADTRVMDSISDPERNFQVNAIGTFTLLQLAREAGIRRFVNASTGGAILGEAPAPIREDMPAHPLSPYGASKLAAEGYCSAYAGAYGLETVSLRFSNVYGQRSFHKGSVIAHFFKQVLSGRELVVYGDGSQTRDYLFVGDLVGGVERAIDADMTGVFQLASGRPTNLNELIAVIRDVVGGDREVRVRYADFRAGEIHTTWCAIDKARRELGFEPATPLRTGLAATWAWFRDESPWRQTGTDSAASL